MYLRIQYSNGFMKKKNKAFIQINSPVNQIIMYIQQGNALKKNWRA